jgi:hypothetical protein
MARSAATPEIDERVGRLVSALFIDLEEAGDTIAEIARRAELGHETVRRLWRNPGHRLRTGPSFLIVAAIARARRLSLDELAAFALEDVSVGDAGIAEEDSNVHEAK